MSSSPLSLPSEPDYVWEVATLFPEQGGWSAEGYLDLTDGTNKRIEFTKGRLEFLPMPTELHQALVGFLYHALLAFVNSRQLGVVPFPPLRVRVRPDNIREPDVLFLRTQNFHLRTSRVWLGADLVMEVVSGDQKDRNRDYIEKLADYAEGKFGEYWIVDPDRQVVLIQKLLDGQYALHGQFAPGEQATSAHLDGFALDVAALFAVAKDTPE